MIIVMKGNAPQSQSDYIMEKILEVGLKPVPLYGTERTVIAIIGDERILDINHIKAFPGVSNVMAVLQPFKLASIETKSEPTIVKVGKVEIGGGTIAMIAGPCAVESFEQVDAAAKAVKSAGANILRGGAFKPRTSPYGFQGLGEEGLKILREIGDKYDMPVITEVLDPRDVPMVCKYADILQIGTRNMQNFRLLEEVGKSQKPVMLKRGMSATVKEWILAAEYILQEGNPNVILCERGIRTFEDSTRNTIAIDAVPLVKELTHLPVIVDPSHGTGRPSLIPAMSKAAIAAGADGLIIDVHCNPETAMCDGAQALRPEQFEIVMEGLAPIAVAIGKRLANSDIKCELKCVHKK
ncbi:MAG: 3-deoxy-7-phosphoheptulonate synthase [Candidatus Peregrinibacteria bacterium]|nr:3-deoxy-7-phosphoheptulonate synthase [Candidatus Peregrinibacteria bacterium]MDZ4244357.1 3-deoxy-7-phosphoheptulonate synthase [Candidatus Gracilibacteria bacterium]